MHAYEVATCHVCVDKGVATYCKACQQYKFFVSMCVFCYCRSDLVYVEEASEQPSQTAAGPHSSTTSPMANVATASVQVMACSSGPWSGLLVETSLPCCHKAPNTSGPVTKDHLCVQCRKSKLVLAVTDTAYWANVCCISLASLDLSSGCTLCCGAISCIHVVRLLSCWTSMLGCTISSNSHQYATHSAYSQCCSGLLQISKQPRSSCSHPSQAFTQQAACMNAGQHS